MPTEPNSNVCELAVLSTDPYLAPNLATNGFYFIGDLFIEDGPGSGYYIIQGREDDILVHSNGEKTNPVPMEITIRRHPIVEQAVVIGHQRFCCSVLIQLNIEEAFKYEFHEIEQKVFDAVQDGNIDAPTHSRIVPALIKLLPMNKRLPVTSKDNVIRKKAELEYGPLIEQMYEQFLNGPISILDSENHLQTKEAIGNYLQITVAKILNKPVALFADHSQSLYSLSLDSLTTIELRNTLSNKFGQLELDIIYENSTIDALASELLRIVNKKQTQIFDDPQHYQETEEIINRYIDFMRAEQQDRTTTSGKSAERPTNEISEERVVLITGANGSLGSHILFQLLKRPQVSRVYCLLRGKDPVDRLRHAMESRKQDSNVLLDTKRVIVLSMDLNKDKLGQSDAIYEQLQNEVTDIIHSAWKMDFNLTIRDFDRECLQGLYHLLQFASSSLFQKLPMRFHFISSIASAGSGLIHEIKEEILPRRIGLAAAHGYGQSKYAGEHICWAAMNLWGKCIFRFDDEFIN